MESPAGKVSHILASASYVSSKQITPEVWELFDASQEVILEQDESSIVEWLATREVRLSAKLSEEEFRRLLVQAPHVPVDMLDRLPALIVAGMLHAPNQSPGPTIFAGVQKRADESKKPLRFLVTDMAAFQETYRDFMDDVEKLRTAMSDPEPGKRAERAIRRAYLAGEAEGVSAQQTYSPDFVELLEEQNEAWLAPLVEALDKGNFFIVISTVDLLSPNGLLKRLRDRGYAVKRALPGSEPSTRMSVPTFLSLDECTEALLVLFKLIEPESASKLEDPSVMDLLLSQDSGRALLSLCRRQTTPWYDCVLDSESMKEVQACDSRYPL